LSSKKRFESIETSLPETPKKLSFLQKFSFKRKLEIEGIERENTKPAEEVTAKVEKAPRRPEPVQTSPARAISKETKVELESLAQEIEIAEERARAQESQQKIAQVQKKAEVDKKVQLEEARSQAESAKTKIFLGILAIPVLAFLVYQASKTIGTGERGGSANFLFIVIVILGVLFRRRRRW